MQSPASLAHSYRFQCELTNQPAEGIYLITQRSPDALLATVWPDDTAHSPICPGLLTPCKPEEAQIVTLVWLRRHSRPWCSLKPQRSYVPYDPLRMWECSDCMNAQLGISQSVIHVSPFYPLFSREITSHFDLKSWHGLCTAVISPPFLWSPFCISLGDPQNM